MRQRVEDSHVYRAEQTTQRSPRWIAEHVGYDNGTHSVIDIQNQVARRRHGNL
jgi:hypothetical protein